MLNVGIVGCSSWSKIIIKEINNNNKIDKDKTMDILNASANYPVNQSKIKNSFPKITFEDESEKIIPNINKKYIIVKLIEPLKNQLKFHTALLVIFIAIISYYIFGYFIFSEI